MQYKKEINAFFNLIKGKGEFSLDKDDYQAVRDIFSTIKETVKKQEIKESAPILFDILGKMSKISFIFFLIGVLSFVVIFYIDLSLSALEYIMIFYLTLACIVLSIVFALVNFVLKIILPK